VLELRLFRVNNRRNMDGSAASGIGILGGTFNPVHLGHLILAQTALETFDLSRILLVPCAVPPHKEAAGLIAAGHRRAMVEAAIEGDLRFDLCDAELRRGGVSYAVDTVRELRRTYPDAALHFLIGSDTLPELHLWKDIYRLLDLCRFAVFARPAPRGGALRPGDLQLREPWGRRLLENRVTGRLVDISSSDIRHRVAEGMSIRYLVPPAVEMYIAEHRLYGGTGGASGT